MAIDPNGKYAYSADSTDGRIHQYTIGADGKLVAQVSNFIAAGGAGTSNLVVTPNAKYVYATNPTGNNIGMFSVAAATGLLTALSPGVITAGTSPYAIAVTSDSKYAFVANRDSQDISQFSIGSDGQLTALAPATVTAPDGGLGLSLRLVKAK